MNAFASIHSKIAQVHPRFRNPGDAWPCLSETMQAACYLFLPYYWWEEEEEEDHLHMYLEFS